MRQFLSVLLLCLLLVTAAPVSGLSPATVKTAVAVQVSPSAHLTIIPGAVTTKAVETTMAPKVFSIVSEPSGAKIWINGNETPFVTPFSIGCPDLIYITLKYPGYQDFSQLSGCLNDQSYTLSVTLVPITTTSAGPANPPDYTPPVYPPLTTWQTLGQTGIIGSQARQLSSPAVDSPTLLQPVTGTGSLSVTTNPAGANVLIDNNPGGASPATIPGLTAGTHNLTIIKPGYAVLITQVNLVDGQTMEYSTTLLPATEPQKKQSKGFGLILTGIAVAGIVVLRRIA